LPRNACEPLIILVLTEALRFMYVCSSSSTLLKSRSSKYACVISSSLA
jgi:hypothetical protein